MAHLPGRTYLVAVITFTLLVGGVTLYLLFRANGYQLLTNPVRLIQTGVISISAHPKGPLEVIVNGQLQPQKTSVLNNVLPGRYSIRLQRPGFVSWETTFAVEAGQAKYLEDIVLFYNQPVLLDLSEAEKTKLTQLLTAQSTFGASITADGGEIRAYDKLITRYSEEIKQAHWLVGDHHLLVQAGQTIRALEILGEHDVILLELPDDAGPVRLLPYAGGAKFAMESQGTLTAYEITPSFSLVPLPSF